MSVGSSPQRSPRKPYQPPSYTQLTPHSAQLALSKNAEPEDEQARRLLSVIERTTGDYSTETDRDRDKVSRLGRVTFLTVIFLLYTEPILLLLAAISSDSFIGRALHHVPILWLPLWALFALWVTLDTAGFYGLAGPRPDPLGVKGLKLSALGLTNVAAALVFLIATKGK